MGKDSPKRAKQECGSQSAYYLRSICEAFTPIWPITWGLKLVEEPYPLVCLRYGGTHISLRHLRQLG